MDLVVIQFYALVLYPNVPALGSRDHDGAPIDRAYAERLVVTALDGAMS